MSLNELVKEYENLKEQLRTTNYLIKVYARTKHKRTYVIQRNRIEKRLKEIYQYIVSYEDKVLIDNSPFSIRSESKRTKGKPRYLLVNGKVQNDMNFALIYYPKHKELYWIYNNNIQLTKNVTKRAYEYLIRRYGENILLCTDKRHNSAFKLDKTQTMIIERQLSRIKKKVYKNLLGNIKTREELLKLYQNVFRELNVKRLA
jgi:hypothetical protein